MTRAEKIAELVAIKRAAKAAPKARAVLTPEQRRQRREDRAQRAHEAEQHAAEHRRRIDAARAIVAAGRCPLCGAPLRRNTSLAGWWMCAQSGAESVRVRPADPPCEWQTFTE